MSRPRIDPSVPLDPQLAQRILDRLVDEKLLTVRDAKRMLAPMAEGELSADDWRLPLEVSAEAKAKG